MRWKTHPSDSEIYSHPMEHIDKTPDAQTTSLTTPFPDSVLATIMSFVVSGSNHPELDRMRQTDTRIQQAIDSNLSLFSRDILLEVECDNRHPLQNLQGVWTLASQTRAVGDRARFVEDHLYHIPMRRTFCFKREVNDVSTELIVHVYVNFRYTKAKYRNKSGKRIEKTFGTSTHGYKLCITPTPRLDTVEALQTWWRQQFPEARKMQIYHVDNLADIHNIVGRISCRGGTSHSGNTPFREGEWFPNHVYEPSMKFRFRVLNAAELGSNLCGGPVSMS